MCEKIKYASNMIDVHGLKQVRPVEARHVDDGTALK